MIPTPILTPDPLLPLIDPDSSYVFTLGTREARLFHQFQNQRTKRQHPCHYYLERTLNSGDIVAICGRKLAGILGLELDQIVALPPQSVALLLRCHQDEAHLTTLIQQAAA